MSLARTIIDNCTGIGESEGIFIDSNSQSVEITNSTAEGPDYGIRISPDVTDGIFTNITIKSIGLSSYGFVLSSGSGNNIFSNLTIISSGIGMLINESTTIANSNIYAIGAEGINISVGDVNIINTSVYSGASHGIALNGSNDCKVINCQIQVDDNTQNCINASSSVNTYYAKNSLLGATVAIDPNVTQAIIATEDNQGNIIL
jgi:hypothetical protein